MANSQAPRASHFYRVDEHVRESTLVTEEFAKLFPTYNDMSFSIKCGDVTIAGKTVDLYIIDDPGFEAK